MGFVRRVISSALDLANLAKHNANFADIETDLTDHNARIVDAKSDIVTHRASASAHKAETITYSGAVTTAESVKEAIDSVKTELTQAIIAGDSGPEAAAARASVSGTVYDTLGDRLNAEYDGVTAQLAETADMLDGLPQQTTVFQRAKTIHYLGHRGMSSIAPENSIPAFELAGTLNMWGGECDIAITSDGIWILMHDDDISRTTNGTGLVSSLTLAQIKSFSIDAGSNIALYPNLKVPTLEEYLTTCKKYSITPMMEIKSSAGSSGYDSLVASIKKYGYEENCIVTSFEFAAIQEIRARSSKIMLQWQGTISPINCGYVAGLRNAGFSVDYAGLTKELVELAHASGLIVSAWTVDSYESVKTLIDYGVDYIVTNTIIGVA